MSVIKPGEKQEFPSTISKNGIVYLTETLDFAKTVELIKSLIAPGDNNSYWDDSPDSALNFIKDQADIGLKGKPFFVSHPTGAHRIANFVTSEPFIVLSAYNYPSLVRSFVTAFITKTDLDPSSTSNMSLDIDYPAVDKNLLVFHIMKAIKEQIEELNKQHLIDLNSDYIKGILKRMRVVIRSNRDMTDAFIQAKILLSPFGIKVASLYKRGVFNPTYAQNLCQAYGTEAKEG